MIVELNRGALPLPANRVCDVEVNLRPVERAVLLVDRVAHAGALERGLQLRFGMPPGRLVAHVLVGHRRELRRERQPEVAVHTLHELNQPFDFLADLLGRDEAVRVIL